MKEFIDKITLGDCRDFLPKISQESVHLFLSDIPYGIGLDEWDVLHNNTNSAYLGQSPAQRGTTAIACRNLNRRFIGFEIDKTYYDAAIKRLQNETRQMRFIREAGKNYS